MREGLADLADLVSKVPVSIPGTPISTKLLGPLGRKLRPTKGDIVQVKERIASKLSQQRRKILIIIDDIDRLTADETREIFRLVKSIADFPNTIYFLSFDRLVVSKMLDKSVEGSGDSYLEKIIQVPFELPLPSRESIRRMLTERIDLIIQDSPQELFDGHRWREIFLSGIDRFITTPRDAVRLANTLSVTYPAVDGEVNIVDFVAIETLRTFRPEVYRAIRSKPDEFTSIAPGDPFSSLGYDPVEARSFHESWLQDVPQENREAIRVIMRRLFPKVDSIWSGSDIWVRPTAGVAP